jgi:hypothetical protein
MNEDTYREIHRELTRARGGRDLDAHDQAYIRRTIDLLPEPLSWAVSQNGDAIFARTKDTMFTIQVGDDNRPSSQAGSAAWRASVRMSSRPIEPDKLRVGLTVGERIADEAGGGSRATTWSFRYQDRSERPEPWQHMVGRIRTSRQGHESLDSREEFARGLAKLAGWRLATDE